MNRPEKKWNYEAAVLLGIFIAAVAVRWLPYKACFAGDRIYFFGSDSYYHLRRVLLSAADFFRMPLTDFYMGFPQGTPNMLSPLVYLLVGGISWLAAGGNHPEPKLIETLSAAAPTVWGALCTIGVFYLGKQLAGLPAGYVAAISMAVMPEFLLQTLVGCFDNNGLEPLLAVGYFLAVSTLLPDGVSSEPRQRCGNPKHIIIAGVTGWLVLFTWRGSLLFFALVVTYCVLEVLTSCFRKSSPGAVIIPVGLSFLIIGVLTLPFVALGLWGSQPIFQFNVISWLHVLVATGSGVLLLLIARIPDRCYQSRHAVQGALLITAVLAAGGILYIFSSPKGGGDVSLYNYLFASNNPWGVQELEGLFRRSNVWSLGAPGKTLTWGVWAFPVVWLTVAWQEIRKESPRPRTILFLVWSLGFMVITVGRMRFAPLASLGIAISLGLLVAHILELSEKSLSAGVQRIMKIAAAALVILLLIPSWTLISGLPSHTYKYPITDDLFDALEWIRGNTPPTAYFEHPSQRPDYGILAQWDFGHWINYIARRPVVATPMLTETYGIVPQARFFLTEDNDEAERILLENRVKYVIITNVLRQLTKFGTMIGLKSGTYMVETRDETGQVVDTVKPAWFRLLSTRLLLNDGLAVTGPDAGLQPPVHLRLVYESRGNLDVRGFDGNVASVKIYEYVEGAKLTGKTTPNAPVSVQVPVVTNQGRLFTWKVSSVSGPDGSFVLTVPYVSGSGEAVHGVSSYLLKTSEGERRILVDRESVVQGKIIEVSKPRRD